MVVSGNAALHIQRFSPRGDRAISFVITICAQHLLAAADRYGLDRLRILCEAKLCEEVNVDTVATTLALAEQHHSSQLKTVCLKFIAANLAGPFSILSIFAMCVQYSF